MPINLQVAFGAYLQVDETMPPQRRQHVVKETDARLHLCEAGAVQVHRHLHLGLAR